MKSNMAKFSLGGGKKMIKGILLGLSIALLAIILEKLVTKGKNDNDDNIKIAFTQYPYKSKMLLTKTEYAFYQILKTECDQNNMLICPKVRMEDFIETTTSEEKQKYRNYIKSRNIDYIICDSKLHILAGIELDDYSHNSTKAQEKDEFKNDVFKTINIPLYRIKTEKNEYINRIKEIINELN